MSEWLNYEDLEKSEFLILRLHKFLLQLWDLEILKKKLG